MWSGDVAAVHVCLCVEWNTGVGSPSLSLSLSLCIYICMYVMVVERWG